MSVKSAVTTRRSSVGRAAASAARGVPHARQNRAPDGFACPQAAQLMVTFPSVRAPLERGTPGPETVPTVGLETTMRQEALALAPEDEQKPRTEFGTGLRARLELVRVRAEPALPTVRRDISPELMLVSPEAPTTEGVLAALLSDPIRAAKRLPLGALLREAGLLDPAEIDFALVRAKEEGRRLGEIVIEYGLVTQNDIVRLVAEQRGLPYVDIASLAVD